MISPSSPGRSDGLGRGLMVVARFKARCDSRYGIVLTSRQLSLFGPLSPPRLVGAALLRDQVAVNRVGVGIREHVREVGHSGRDQRAAEDDRAELLMDRYR